MGIPYFDIAALPIFFLIFWTIVLRKMTRGRCNVLYLAVIVLSMIADTGEIIEKVITFYNTPLTPEHSKILQQSLLFYKECGQPFLCFLHNRDNEDLVQDRALLEEAPYMPALSGYPWISDLQHPHFLRLRSNSQ